MLWVLWVCKWGRPPGCVPAPHNDAPNSITMQRCALSALRSVVCNWRGGAIGQRWLGVSAAASADEGPSTTGRGPASSAPARELPSLPPTLAQLQGTLQASHCAMLSALDKQLSQKHQDLVPSPEEAAALDDDVVRHALASSTYSTGQLRALRLLSRYNASLPSLRGQEVLATVLAVTPEAVTVDSGSHGVTRLPRASVSIAHIHTDTGVAPQRSSTGTACSQLFVRGNLCVSA